MHSLRAAELIISVRRDNALKQKCVSRRKMRQDTHFFLVKMGFIRYNRIIVKRSIYNVTGDFYGILDMSVKIVNESHFYLGTYK